MTMHTISSVKTKTELA